MAINNLTFSELVALGSFILPLLALSFSSLRYVNVKRSENRQQRFENYHALVHKMVRSGSEGIGMDSQRAIIFELRNYPEYKEITLRIMNGLKEYWNEWPELKKELELSIHYLEKKRRFF